MRRPSKNSNMPSPLKQGSKLRPWGHKIRKTIAVTVTLTSLIDAFVILVLYLVVASSPTDHTLNIEDNIHLPQTKIMQELDGSPIVTYKGNSFFIEEKAVPDSQLKDSLIRLTQKFKGILKNNEGSIIIQADENIGFEKLQPLLVASSYAGIKHVKFAVLQKD